MQQAHLGKSIKNDMWITEDEDESTPDVLPELPGFHVLVRPVSIKEKTKRGILLPNSTKDDMSYLTTIGQVIKIGDLAYNDNEKFPKDLKKFETLFNKKNLARKECILLPFKALSKALK